MTEEYYPDLPEGVAAGTVAPLVLQCVADSDREAPAVTIGKLKELGDRQWHAYALPTDAVRRTVQNWAMHQFATDGCLHQEELLSIGYCFGFEKESFSRLLESYAGEHRAEFEENLRRSSGVLIDPWWSLRETPNQPSQSTQIKRGD